MEKDSLKPNSKPSFEFVQELLKSCNNHSTECFLRYADTSWSVFKISAKAHLSSHSSVSGYQITHCVSCLINYTKTPNRKGLRLTVVSESSNFCCYQTFFIIIRVQWYLMYCLKNEQERINRFKNSR